MPSISTRKLKFRNGSCSCPVLAMFDSLSAFHDLGATVPKTEAPDDECGPPARRHADLDVEPALCRLEGRIQALVDAHLVRLLARLTGEPAVLPDAVQKLADGSLEALPEWPVVRLEHRP